MRAVYKAPGKAPEIIEIENELAPLQNIVGGYIETVSLGGDLLLIVNEEGRLLGLEPNICLESGIYREEILGPLLILKNCGEEFGSLTEEESVMVLKKIRRSNIWEVR